MTPAWEFYLFGAVFFGLAAMIVAGVWRAIAKGELPSRSFRPIIKWEHPAAFWINITIYSVMAGSLFLFSLALFGFAPHWFLKLFSAMHH